MSSICQIVAAIFCFFPNTCFNLGKIYVQWKAYILSTQFGKVDKCIHLCSTHPYRDIKYSQYHQKVWFAVLECHILILLNIIFLRFIYTVCVCSLFLFTAEKYPFSFKPSLLPLHEYVGQSCTCTSQSQVFQDLYQEEAVPCPFISSSRSPLSVLWAAFFFVFTFISLRN